MVNLRLAWVFVVMMVACSAAFNFAFGWRLGEHSYTVTQYVHDGFIYGTLSIAADGFKIVFGVLALHFFMARGMGHGMRVLGFLACGILFLGATLYSLNSAIGSISTNRTDTAGLREAKATNYDAVKTQLERAQKEQSWLDQEYRAAAAVEADMAGLRQSNLWSRTAGCTNVTVPDSRVFCQKYSALQSEHGTSLRAEELDAKVETLTNKLAGMGGAIIADPHAKMIHDLTGYGQPAIVLAWLLLVVALVEGGSTIGPIALSLAHRAIRSAATAAKSDAAPLAGTKFSPPVCAARTPLPHPAGKIAGVKATLSKTENVLPEPSSPEIPDNSPAPAPNSAKSALNSADGADFDGPGTPVSAPAPDPVQEVVTPVSANVVQFFKDKDTPKAEWKIQKPARKKPKDNSVSRWMREHTQSSDAGTGTKDCYAHYHAYCVERDIHFLSKRQFSAILAGLLDMPKSKEGKRSKHGRVFPLMIVERQAMKRRA